MYSSNTLSFSPLIADTPNLEVTFDGKPTIYYKYTTSEGKSSSETVSTNNGTTGSSSTTRTNTITHSLVNGWSGQVAFGHKWGVAGVGATAETNWQVTLGYNGNVSIGDTYTFSQAASQGWSKSWSNGKSESQVRELSMICDAYSLLGVTFDIRETSRECEYVIYFQPERDIELNRFEIIARFDPKDA